MNRFNQTVAAHAAAKAPSSSKKGLLSRVSEYAKKVAGILGFAAVTGVASTAMAPVPANAQPGLSDGRSVPMAPSPERPIANRNAQFWDREWRAVTVKGIGARDFVKSAFDREDWHMLVDEDGKRLRDPLKLRFGKSYLLAANEEDAKTIAKVLGTFNGNLAREISNSSPSAVSEAPKQAKKAERNALSHLTAPTMDVKSFISYAKEHIGKKYVLGGNGVKSIDCSQLIIESLKKGGVVGSTFDTTANGLKNLSKLKPVKKIEAGDVVYLGHSHASHVAIALSAPDAKGYVEILDAAKSQGAVSVRSFHTSIIASAGSLPFVSRSAPTVAPEATVLAQSDTPVVAKTVVRASVETVAKAEKTEKAAPIVLAQAETEKKPAPVAKPVERPVAATVAKIEKPVAKIVATKAPVVEERKVVAIRPKTSTPAVAAERAAVSSVSQLRSDTTPTVEKIVTEKVSAASAGFARKPIPNASAREDGFEASNVIKTSFVSEPRTRAAEQVSIRTNAKVIDMVSRSEIASTEVGMTAIEKLSSRPIDELISEYRAKAEAANDPIYARQAELTVKRLEITMYSAQKNMVGLNVDHWKKRAATGERGAFETLVKLNKTAEILERKITERRIEVAAANDSSFAQRRAA